MPVSLGGVPCLSPAAVYEQCLRSRLPVAWASLPNSFACPSGTRPGEGWALMALSALQRLSRDLTFPEPYDLAFTSGPSLPGEAVLKGLVAVKAECVTPGARGGDAAYLVRLADRRHFLDRFFVDAGVGVRHRFTAAALSAAPAWADAVAAVWAAGAAVLGDFPGLPPEADTSRPPEDLELYQASVADSLDLLLGLLGCDLAWRPLTGLYSVVATGADDPAYEAAAARWDRLRVRDAYPLRGDLAALPAGVRVRFKKLPHVRGDGSPWYAVDVPDPDAGGGMPGTLAAVDDDTAAVYDAAGRLTNEAALAAAAGSRAADYFRSLRAGSPGERLLYPTALSEPGLMPGPRVAAVRWAETAAAPGTTTEVSRAGMTAPPRLADGTIDPLTEVVRIVGPAGSETGGGAAGLLDAYVQRWDSDARAWRDRQRIWVRDANA